MKSINLGAAGAAFAALVLFAYADASGSAADRASAGVPRAERIAVEREIGRNELVPRLEAAMGSAFGGVWFEPSTAQLHVGVTSPESRATAEDVAARAGLTANVTSTPVRSTRPELVAAQERLNGALRDLFARGEAETSIAPDENAVHVKLGAEVSAAARRRVEVAASRSDVGVSVSVVSYPKLRPELQARCKEHKNSSAHCEPTIVGGVTIENENELLCTAGPAAIIKEPTSVDTATETYLLTAGHCIDPTEKGGSGVGGGWTAFNKAGQPIALGLAQEFLNAQTDVGVIKITSNVWAEEAFTPVVPYVAQWSEVEETNPFEVAGQGTPVKKMEACYSGQTSGRACGEILNENLTYEFTEGVKTEGLVEVTGVATEKGDSGSPWYGIGTPLEAQGTHVGIKEGGNALFQRLDVSFAKLNTKLELLTEKNKVRHPLRFKSEGTPTVLTGEQHEGNDVVTVDAGTLSCGNVTYTGEAVGTEAVEVTVAPTYSECKVFGFLTATVDTNGCKYRFKTLKKEGSDLEGVLDIVCPGENQIEVTAPGCTVSVGPQTDIGSVTYTNVGSGAEREVTVDVNLSGFAYEEHEVEPGLSCANDTEETENGTYTASAVVAGENGSAEQVGIWVE